MVFEVSLTCSFKLGSGVHHLKRKHVDRHRSHITIIEAMRIIIISADPGSLSDLVHSVHDYPIPYTH